MKKNELERLLQQIPPHSAPKAELEQYSTPANIAADMLFTAYANGDIFEKKVLDLGCGTGILAIGAYLLGGNVTGIELDPAAYEEAQINVKNTNSVVELINADINDVELHVDTVIMNPPFGSQRKNADRPFLELACRSAERVYSLHNAATLEFLKKIVEALGGEIFLQKEYILSIPHMFQFHNKAKKNTNVVLIGIDIHKV